VAERDDIDPLFFDLIMPGGMTRLVLADEPSLERSGTAPSEFEIMSKPRRRTDLVRKMRATLNAGAAR